MSSSLRDSAPHNRCLKTGQIHRAANLWILHESMPDELASRILRHENGNAQVDSDHIPINPTSLQVKCIDKAVSFPDAVSESFPHRTQCVHGLSGQERDRSGWSSRDQCAVQRTERRRTTPNDIALCRIGCGDPPEIRTEVLEAIVKANAKQPVCAGGQDRILEIVGLPVASCAEIKPCMGVLVGE
jgi:hypothetical protein